MPSIEQLIDALVEVSTSRDEWPLEAAATTPGRVRALCTELVEAVRADEAAHHISYWHRLYASLTSADDYE